MDKYKEFVTYLRGKRQILPPHLDSTIRAFQRLKLPDIAGVSLNSSDHTQTPQVLIDYAQEISSIAAPLYSLATGLPKFTPVYDLATIEEAIDDLSAIEKEAAYNNVLCLPEVQQIVFIFPDVVMYDPHTDQSFSFGSFKCIMAPKAVYLQPAGGNTQVQGYYHPYLNDSKLCMGDFAEAYNVCMNGLRFFNAFSLVKQCIMNYAGEANNGTKAAPHQTLYLWLGQVCAVCDELVKHEDVTVCESSNKPICPKCIDSGLCTDTVNNTYHLPSFIQKCAECGVQTSGIIRGKCLNCRKQVVKI